METQTQREEGQVVTEAETGIRKLCKPKNIRIVATIRSSERSMELIPSVRRLVWAGKPQLGNAAWGASFPSERALPAGGFGSVHTPSP